MIVNFGYGIDISQMTKQTKNKFIFGGCFLLFVILMVFAENKLESYVKYLFSENNFIGLILIIPLALYIFKQVDKKLNKTIHNSSTSKKIFKNEKSYGKKMWSLGKCYKCKTQSLTVLAEENLPLGKKLKCINCGSLNFNIGYKKKGIYKLAAIPVLILSYYQFFDILEQYKFYVFAGGILSLGIEFVVSSFFMVHVRWDESLTKN